MAPLHCDTSYRSEMHSKTPSNLAMHNIVFSSVHLNGISLVEQGAAMKTTISSFHIPPASMSNFDILSVATFIFIYRRVLDPLVALRMNNAKGLTELQRMGIGLFIAILAMVTAGAVECFRLNNAKTDCPKL